MTVHNTTSFLIGKAIDFIKYVDEGSVIKVFLKDGTKHYVWNNEQTRPHFTDVDVY